MNKKNGNALIILFTVLKKKKRFQIQKSRKEIFERGTE